MSNLNGWSLTGRLITKHFGAMGDSIAAMIANFDPETATEADRDNLAARLQEVAKKYAKAKADFEKEHNDVVTLKASISSDINVAAALGARLAAGSIDEATATLFCDELEAEKARLPGEEQQEHDAQAFMDEIKGIMDQMSTQLSQFDAQATKAKRALASAQAQLDLQNTRRAQQEDLRSMSGAGGSPSTAMTALQKRAADMQAQAAGMRVVTDIGNKPADDKAKLDALRSSVASGASGAPTSLADRLKALATA